MKISLTKRAAKSYNSIKEYLISEWGENVAGAFEQKTIDFLDILEAFPEIGALALQEKQIRRFQLTKQTKVFYRIKGEQIIVLNFLM